MEISAVSATFFCFFPAFWAGLSTLSGLGCCLGDLCGFSYFFLLFPAFFRIFDGVWGAVLRIYAVSATFSCSFTDFGLWFGVLFCEFLRFQLHKARLLCYQPMAIVHYDNLKIQYFLNKKIKKSEFSEKYKIVTAQIHRCHCHIETFLPKYYDKRVKRYHRCMLACNSMYTLVPRTTPRK